MCHIQSYNQENFKFNIQERTTTLLGQQTMSYTIMIFGSFKLIDYLVLMSLSFTLPMLIDLV